MYTATFRRGDVELEISAPSMDEVEALFSKVAYHLVVFRADIRHEKPTSATEPRSK